MNLKHFNLNKSACIKKFLYATEAKNQVFLIFCFYLLFLYIHTHAHNYITLLTASLLVISEENIYILRQQNENSLHPNTACGIYIYIFICVYVWMRLILRQFNYRF